MTEQDMNEFEPTRDDDADLPVDPIDASSTESEASPETIESKDPTLRVIESEFAIFGLSRNIGHVPDRHVWGD